VYVCDRTVARPLAFACQCSPPPSRAWLLQEANPVSKASFTVSVYYSVRWNPPRTTGVFNLARTKRALLVLLL
jgi:hypothetical protein